MGTGGVLKDVVDLLDCEGNDGVLGVFVSDSSSVGIKLSYREEGYCITLFLARLVETCDC